MSDLTTAPHPPHGKPSPSDSPAVLSRDEVDLLRAEVGAALHESKAALSELDKRLVQRVQSLVKAMPRGVQASLLAFDPQSPFYRAYLLGQLSFAQVLVSEAAASRADDDFVDHLQSSTYAQLARLLFQWRELSNQRLADLLDESPEGISRKLRVLRNKGITDFRKDGRVVLNFLTPAARRALEQLHEAAEGRSA